MKTTNELIPQNYISLEELEVYVENKASLTEGKIQQILAYLQSDEDAKEYVKNFQVFLENGGNSKILAEEFQSHQVEMDIYVQKHKWKYTWICHWVRLVTGIKKIANIPITLMDKVIEAFSSWIVWQVAGVVMACFVAVFMLGGGQDATITPTSSFIPYYENWYTFRKPSSPQIITQEGGQSEKEEGKKLETNSPTSVGVSTPPQIKESNICSKKDSSFFKDGGRTPSIAESSTPSEANERKMFNDSVPSYINNGKIAEVSPPPIEKEPQVPNKPNNPPIPGKKTGDVPGTPASTTRKN